MEETIRPDDLVERLVRQGMTDEEIVRHLDRHEQVRVTREAVAAWRERHGMGGGADAAP